MKERVLQGKIAHMEPMGNVGADFVVKRGYRHGRMPQPLLHLAQISAAVQAVGGRGGERPVGVPAVAGGLQVGVLPTVMSPEAILG
jgi:hypothetical protein